MPRRPPGRQHRPSSIAVAPAWPTLGTLVALVIAAALASCAVTPRAPRSDQAPTRANPANPVNPANTAALAQAVAVTGPRGRLPTAQRQALLARLGQQGSASLLQRQLAAMAEDGAVQLLAGNDARLLVDGPATFEAMFAAMEHARESILLESYIVEDVAVAQKLAALLTRKRAQGLEVALMYDALGSFGTDKAFFDQLRQAGVAVCAFNPVNPAERPGYWDITERDHRKILAVDRQQAFTGGINISGVYSSGSFGRGQRRPAIDPNQGWRDTQISLRGTAAAVLDDLVRQTWQRQRCQPALAAPQAMANSPAAGPAVVRIVPAAPDDEINRIYALLLTAIDTAQVSVHLTMAYFAPGQDMIDALCDAARRGVDVQLLLPSVSDFSPVLYAGQSYYQQLLDAGVKLHSLQSAVLHAKTAVVDGVLSTVGSSNMDWRSFAGNQEVNAVVLGEDFGDEMARMFQRDIGASAPIAPAAWSQRPALQRAKEWLARALERWW